MVLDIDASREKREPNYTLIGDFASECFMPLSYGGGITSVEQAKKIVQLGVEKISLNTPVLDNPQLVRQISEEVGTSSTVVCIDIKSNLLGRPKVYDHRKQRCSKLDPVDWAQQLIELGAGEIIIQSVDSDGTQQGYDIDLISKVCQALTVPTVALGGAGRMEDFEAAWAAGVSAVAAGSYFVFQGRHRAVLITYPDYADIQKCYKDSQR